MQPVDPPHDRRIEVTKGVIRDAVHEWIHECTNTVGAAPQGSPNKAIAAGQNMTGNPPHDRMHEAVREPSGRMHEYRWCRSSRSVRRMQQLQRNER